MNIRDRARVLLLASTLVAAVGALPTLVPLASAEPIRQGGPGSRQCNLDFGLEGEFVGPGQSDSTIDANIALSGLSGAPDFEVAGCDLLAEPPPPPPTPTPTPPRRPYSAIAGTFALR